MQGFVMANMDGLFLNNYMGLCNMSMALFFSMNVVGSRYNEACFKAAIQESIGKWVLLNPLAKSSILHKQQTVYSKVGF
jgi:hypothetical protein